MISITIVFDNKIHVSRMEPRGGLIYILALIVFVSKKTCIRTVLQLPIIWFFPSHALTETKYIHVAKNFYFVSITVYITSRGGHRHRSCIIFCVDELITLCKIFRFKHVRIFKPRQGFIATIFCVRLLYVGASMKKKSQNFIEPIIFFWGGGRNLPLTLVRNY